MPRRIGDTGIGLIRPQVDIDARIDQEPNCVQVPRACDQVQGGQALPLDERVDALVEHRCQDARIPCVRGFEPYASIEAIGLPCRSVAGSRCRGSGLAGCKANESERWTGKPAA